MPVQNFYEHPVKHYQRNQIKAQVICVTLFLLCEWPFLRATLGKHCATSHKLPPRRPTLKITVRSKITSLLKRMCSSLSEQRSLPRQRGLGCGCLYLHIQTSFRQASQLPKQECGEGIKVSSPFFFFLPHPPHLSNAKYSKSEGCFKSSVQKFSHNPVTADTPNS